MEKLMFTVKGHPYEISGNYKYCLGGVKKIRLGDDDPTRALLGDYCIDPLPCFVKGKIKCRSSEVINFITDFMVIENAEVILETETNKIIFENATFCGDGTVTSHGDTSSLVVEFFAKSTRIELK